MSGHQRRSIAEAEPPATPPVPGPLEIVLPPAATPLTTAGARLHSRAGPRPGRGRLLNPARLERAARFVAVSAGRLLRIWMKFVNKP